MNGTSPHDADGEVAASFASEAEFVTRLGGAESGQAWDEFFERYGPVAYQVARRRGMGIHDAEDIVQDTMTVMVRELLDRGHDSGRASLKTRVVQIVRGKIIDLQRKARKAARLCQTFAEIQAPRAESASQFENRDHSVEALNSALSAVQNASSPGDFAIFQRIVMDEVPARMVALETEKTIKAIYSSTARVKASLRSRTTQILGTC